jgi:dephospho-CoA kinase
LGESKKEMKQLKSQFHKLKSENRLFGLTKPVIAITGGIATGKSSVTEILRRKGLGIIDADKLVKSIYQTKKAEEFIQMNIPEAFSETGIDFRKLRELFFESPEIKKSIEEFIYPNLKDAFLKEASTMTQQNFYIYDVPLLFERGIDVKVDAIIVVYAPKEIQIERVIQRDRCSRDLAEKILSEQFDIESKKTKGDFVISNVGSKNELAAEVDKLLLQLFTEN